MSLIFVEKYFHGILPADIFLLTLKTSLNTSVSERVSVKWTVQYFVTEAVNTTCLLPDRSDN